MAEDRPADHHLDHRVDEALRVAQRYYLHGVTMDVIARQMGTSRSTVSRLLQYARDSGLVEIRVLPPDARAHPLEQSLAESFGIRAHVAHVPSTATTVERLERTAVEAARLLHSIFESDMIIAISWGTMVNAISECLIPKATTNCQFVQLNGMHRCTVARRRNRRSQNPMGRCQPPVRRSAVRWGHHTSNELRPRPLLRCRSNLRSTN